MACSECGNSYPIVNKRYNLCSKCNRIRLDNQSSKKARDIRKKIVKEKDAPDLYIEKAKLYEEIASEREWRCSGCGSPSHLSHSHIISVKKRKDLELVKENIVYDCLSMGEKEGCHDKWESGNIQKMMEVENFEERMEYIRKIDKKYYNLLITKLNAIKGIRSKASRHK